MRLHAARQVRLAQADAARLVQDADRVAQAANVAPGVRLHAAHGDGRLGVGRGRVVPVVAQPLGLHGAADGGQKHIQSGLRDLGAQVAGHGRLQHHVGRGPAAEFLDPALAGGELVHVEHHLRAVARGDGGHGARFGRAQQQMVAVDVGAVRAHALEGGRAIGVGARQGDDVHAFEQRRAFGRGPAFEQHQHGLARRRLVAVLVRDQHQRRSLGPPAAAFGEQHGGQIAALRAGAGAAQAHAARVRFGQGLQARHHLRVAGEIGLRGVEARRGKAHASRVGEMRGHARRFGRLSARVELRPGVVCYQKISCWRKQDVRQQAIGLEISHAASA